MASVLFWRFWSDEYSGGLVRLMQGLHGEWLPCPTSPTVTHTKTPRREKAMHSIWENTFFDSQMEGIAWEKIHFLIVEILTKIHTKTPRRERAILRIWENTLLDCQNSLRSGRIKEYLRFHWYWFRRFSNKFCIKQFWNFSTTKSIWKKILFDIF